MASEKLNNNNMGFDTSQSLREEYKAVQMLFELQPALTQRFLEAQGRQLAEAVLKNQSQVRFSLPDRVVVEASALSGQNTAQVPSESREQVTGGMIDRLTRSDIRTVLRQRLAELEGSSRKAVSVSAQLIRFATARFMVYSMLPSGRSVLYLAPEGEEIPSIPAEEPLNVESAITEQNDAIAQTGEAEQGRGELQVPFVPDARRFFLPQWVAFGQQGNLLVNSVGEAESHVGSMQRYLSILHAAVALAPYFVADAEYHQKRYGMLGQLVNQGRALACYQTQDIIQIIKRRAAAHDLNRGLSLSLPFFDDQLLEIRSHDFTVIPAGRIMFVPAFVVRASWEEQAKVAQDTRLSPSTRKYLLVQLKMLENAFSAPLPAASKD
jgi:hypothetical protein